MDNYLRRKLTILVVTMCLGGIIGAAYAMWLGGRYGFGFTTGVFITTGVIGFELFYVQQPAGAWLRHLPTPVFLLLTTLVWVLIIALALHIVPLLFGEDQAYPEHYQASTFTQDFLFSFIVAFVINGLLRIRRLVGGRILTNFLLGRYYRPLEEERIFLFLDLTDSTGLAEKLGDIKAQSMIRQFFFDIARPIAQCGGETHRYIGDEVVVCWPLLDPARNYRVIDCVFRIDRLMSARASFYQKKYGTVPQFRVGIHGGTVVASEVGDDKREIVYFGDTVNTASRVQALGKKINEEFLITAELLDQIEKAVECLTEPIGEYELPGKKRPISICRVTKAPD